FNALLRFLVSEGVWPQDCILDCVRGRHRAVCGTNGQLYKSLCAFKRAQCLNSQLRSVPLANCMDNRESKRVEDSIQTKCQMVRTQALQSINHSDMVSVFVPECSAEGTFLPVQCHNQTGYCWCSTPDGKPVGGTSVLHQRPNCTKEDTEMRPTADYSVNPPAREITAPPFWVTILLNSDPRGNRQTKKPTDTPRTCEVDRARLLDEVQSQGKEERFVPACGPDGRYHPVQCHITTGYCWCVRVETGRPLPGTSTRNQVPDCRAEDMAHGQQESRYSNRPLAGCPGTHKEEFLQKLLVSTSSVPDTSSPAPLEWGMPQHGGEEGALQWYFQRLDTDGNGILSERELRPFRLYLRRWLNPRRCAKKFARYCDRNSDRTLTRAELINCLHL
ncbi:SPARC-related modular calcium-binding protein 1-like, partial [Scleropages formosus]